MMFKKLFLKILRVAELLIFELSLFDSDIVQGKNEF